MALQEEGELLLMYESDLKYKDQDCADAEQQALPFREHVIAGGRHHSIVKAENEQQNAADEVEMGMRWRHGKILPDAHLDSPEHADDQKNNARAHHQ